MNIENEINVMLKKAILDEIDNLAIKSVVREHVENAISKNEVVDKIDKVIDSYFRSALNKQNVEEFIRSKLNSMVESRVKEEFYKIFGGYSSWKGSQAVEEALMAQIRTTVNNGFEVSCIVKEKAKNTNTPKETEG